MASKRHISGFLSRIAGFELAKRSEKKHAIIDSALKRVRREHDLAITALARSYRVQPNTKTHEKHRADYERHDENHRLIIGQLREVLAKEAL